METSSPFSYPSHEELEPHRQEVLRDAAFADVLAIDTETTGLAIRDGRDYCIGISIAYRCDGEVKAAYYPVAHTEDNMDQETIEHLKLIILTRKALVAHNLKFDQVSLTTTKIGIDISNRRRYCTMLMAHFLNENLMSKELEYLTKKFLGKEGKLKGLDWRFFFNIQGWSADFPSEVMDAYGTEDAVDALELFELAYPDFKKAGFDGPSPLHLDSIDGKKSREPN